MGRSPKMGGTSPRPWVKLWREESAGFASLPVIARALAAEMLKFTDGDGRIELAGTRLETEMRTALWRLIGAHPRERQTLGRHLVTLIERGTLTVEEGAYVFPQWAPRQGSAQLERNWGTTRTQLERNQGAIQNEAKCPKSHDRKKQEEEEEKEEEKEVVVETVTGDGSAGPPEPATTTTGSGFGSTSELLEAAGRFGTPSGSVASSIRRLWAECWSSRTAQPPPPVALVEAAAQAGLFVAEAERLGVSPHELAARSITGFFAAKAGYRRPRVEWWTEDPLRWAGDEPDAAAPPPPAKPDRFVPLSVTRDGKPAIEWQDNETGASWWQGEKPPEGSIQAFLEYYHRRRQEAAGGAQASKVAQGA